MSAFNAGRYGPAIKELGLLANQGDARAAWSLARAYERGIGVDKDPLQAERWSTRATKSLVRQTTKSPAPVAPGKRKPPSGTAGSATAVIIDRKGHLLTSRHVVANCKSLNLVIGKVLVPAIVAAVQPDADLALVRIRTRIAATPAQFPRSPKLRQGEPVVVTGFPLQGFLSPKMQANSGVIAALAGPRGNPGLFQVSVGVQPGSSGGPVLDSQGRLIGLVVGTLKPEDARRAGAFWPAPIGFAVPAQRIIAFLRNAGVGYYAQRGGSPMEVPEVVALARGFTVPVHCRRQQRTQPAPKESGIRR